MNPGPAEGGVGVGVEAVAALDAEVAAVERMP